MKSDAPIRLRCASCQASLSATAGRIGEVVACTRCGKEVLIWPEGDQPERTSAPLCDSSVPANPGLADSGSTGPAEPTEPGMQDNGILVVCEACGGKLRAKAELTGRLCRCPKCGAEVLVWPEESAPPAKEVHPLSASSPSASSRLVNSGPPVAAEVMFVPQESERSQFDTAASVRGSATDAEWHSLPRHESRVVARRAVICAVCVCVVSVCVGALASQFFPFFGGWIAQIAEPLSPARLQLLPVHCVVFGLIGAFVGAALGIVWAVGWPSQEPHSHSRRSHRRSVFVPFLVTLSLVAACGLCGLFFLVMSTEADNAICPLCHKSFHISEDYRGNISSTVVEIPCPRCGQRSPPCILYTSKPESKKTSSGHPSEERKNLKRRLGR